MTRLVQRPQQRSAQRIAAIVDTGRWQTTGLSRVNNLIVDGMRRRGWAVLVHDLGHIARNWSASVPVDGVRLATNLLIWIPRLVSTILRCDIVYSTLGASRLGFLKTAIVVWLARILGKRIVLHNHSGGFRHFYLESGQGMRSFVRATLSRVDALIVVQDLYRSHFRFLRSQPKIVPNGVAGVSPVKAAHWTKPVRLLFVGNLHVDKGYLDLAYAVARRRDRVRDIELEIVGSVPSNSGDQAGFSDLLTVLRADSGIRYLGPLDRSGVTEAMLRAHFVCLPSRYRNEALPMVIIEGFALATPAIVSNFRALKHLVPPQAGFLVDLTKNNLDSTLDRVLELDESCYAALAAGAYAEWKNRYTLEGFEMAMDEIFRAVT